MMEKGSGIIDADASHVGNKKRSIRRWVLNARCQWSRRKHRVGGWKPSNGNSLYLLN